MSKTPESEDEYDDLDDVLEEFEGDILSQPPGSALPKATESSNAAAAPTTSASQPSSYQPQTSQQKTDTKAAPSSSAANATQGAAAKQPQNAQGDDPELSVPELDEEFAKKLQLGVDYLLNEMNDSPEAQQEFEQLMKQMSESTGAQPTTTQPPPKASASSSTPSTSTPGNNGNSSKAAGFQDTISQTMDRLKESNKEMNNSTSASNTDDEFLQRMIKELGNASGGGGGGADGAGGGVGGDGMDMSGLLAEMLQELSSKEILYEPIKEMQEKYPAWLEQNASKCSKEDLDRYKEQQRLINEMCGKFESPSYCDSDTEARKFISDRMEQMQKSGAPPSDLVGNLASGAIPGMDMGSDGLPQMPKELEDCNVQ